MQTELQALDEALGRAKALKRGPDRGRQVVAEFRVRQADRSLRMTFIRSVPYLSGFADGLGGCEVELELVDRPGYVSRHHGDGPEQALASAAATYDGWCFEPGSLSLIVAHGFARPDRVALVGAWRPCSCSAFVKATGPGVPRRCAPRRARACDRCRDGR